MAQIDRADIQGNVLDGYTFDRVRHLFVRFEPKRGKVPLAKLISQITTAERWKPPAPDSTLNLGLSYAGLKELGLSDAALAGFPQAFRDGMRARAVELGDDTNVFEGEWADPIHLWLWIHASDEAGLSARDRDVQAALGSDAKVILSVDGYKLRENGGEPIEHFGFRDGISQPALAESLNAPLPGDGIQNPDGSWRPLAVGEFLLGHVDEAGEAVRFGGLTDVSENGTFAVFRQLRQDVGAFHKYVKDQADKLRPSDSPHSSDSPDFSESWIAERMVGRRKDGTMLSEAGEVPKPQLNSFSFRGDDDGRVCPLGAHVRRANPRGSEGFLDSFARHRILRRGYPYGPRWPQAGESQSTTPVSRGLLFVALNADLERQFEFLQRRYMNDGAASRQGRDVDPVVGVPNPASNFVIPGDASADRDTVICPNVPAFVTCLGGEYFFLPGKRGLAAIKDAAVDAPYVESAPVPMAAAAASSAQSPAMAVVMKGASS